MCRLDRSSPVDEKFHDFHQIAQKVNENNYTKALKQTRQVVIDDYLQTTIT